MHVLSVLLFAQIAMGKLSSLKKERDTPHDLVAPVDLRALHLKLALFVHRVKKLYVFARSRLPRLSEDTVHRRKHFSTGECVLILVGRSGEVKQSRYHVLLLA